MNGILWFTRATVSCIGVFMGDVLLLPVQILVWMLSKQRWGDTEPYSYLGYICMKGVASPGESVRPYASWKQNRHT